MTKFPVVSIEKEIHNFSFLIFLFFGNISIERFLADFHHFYMKYEFFIFLDNSF